MLFMVREMYVRLLSHSPTVALAFVSDHGFVSYRVYQTFYWLYTSVICHEAPAPTHVWHRSPQQADQLRISRELPGKFLHTNSAFCPWPIRRLFSSE